MPRPAVDLEPYKALISNLYEENHSANCIADILQERYQVKVKGRTIKTRLQDWNQSKRYVMDDSPQLRMQISNLFINCCLKNSKIIKILRTEGYHIGLISLIRIRKKLGLHCRSTVKDQNISQNQLQEIVQNKLDKEMIQGHGRDYLFTHFRSQGHIVLK